MSTRSNFVRPAVIAAVLALAACGGDPQVPTALESTVSAAIAAPVASVVGQIPSVRITDQRGRGIRNVLVRWRVTAGGGRVVNDSARTSSSGEASSGGWTLGTIAGTQTLTATAEGVPTVTFTATAAPGPVAVLARVSREAQEAVINTLVPEPPSVRAEDSFGNAVPNVPVSFSISLGTGSLTGEVQTTNASGIATLGSWRLGTQAGQQIVRATALGAQGAAFLASALPGAPVELIKIAGDDQQAVSGIAVTIPPGVRVVDAFANPVGNVPVTFTPE
jgi:adhesin/invasin